MLVNRISNSLLCLLIIFCFSCESVQNIHPENLDTLEEADLLPVNSDFEEMDQDENHMKLFSEGNCSRLARIRESRSEGICRYYLEIRGKRFLSPVNALEFDGAFKNGRIVRIGIDRAEERTCDRGIPVLLNCMESIRTRREFRQRGDVSVDDAGNDGN